MLGRTKAPIESIAKTQHRLKVGISSISGKLATYKCLMPRNSVIKDVSFYDHHKDPTSFLLRYFSGVAGDRVIDYTNAPSHTLIPLNINVRGGIIWFIIDNVTMTTLEIFYEV